MSLTNDDFDMLGNFAHDLKTPLAAVKSYIELIEHSGDLNDQQSHFANRALLGVERMQRIINLLLDYARLERQEVLQLEVCDMTSAVDSVVHLMENSIQAKQLKVKIQIPSKEQFVHADPHLFDLIVSNLIINAIKYNRPQGELVIEAHNARDFVQLDVRDTGIGIPHDELEHVWERFYRVGRRNHREIEGTGLGLAIVKTVVEKHGGGVSVHSIENEGTTFSITLPRAPSSSEYDREASDDIDDQKQEQRESLEDSDSDIR